MRKQINYSIGKNCFHICQRITCRGLEGGSALAAATQKARHRIAEDQLVKELHLVCWQRPIGKSRIDHIESGVAKSDKPPERAMIRPRQAWKPLPFMLKPHGERSGIYEQFRRDSLVSVNRVHKVDCEVITQPIPRCFLHAVATPR